jgi:maltose alpha-D-glucosyltransferase / alpha-amylase
MRASETGAVPVKSLADPLDAAAAAKLAEVLPEYIATQRWYRAKTRSIEKVAVEDVFALPGSRAQILILKITYADGDSDSYILPISIAEPRVEPEGFVTRIIAENGEQAILQNALADESFRDALLNAIIYEEKVNGRNGTLFASRTSVLPVNRDRSTLPKIDSFVSRAEQSNTSIVYRDCYILKLFRKLESGINPDVEIGTFLTARKFKNTPAVLGSLEYHEDRNQVTYGVGILQQFIPNKGDAWKYTLDCLQAFLDRALSSKRVPPPLPTEHPLAFIGQEIPQKLRTLIGPYLETAVLLGKRTAEMHAALGDPAGGPDFEPEPFTLQDGQKLYHDLISQADLVFGLVRRKQAALNGAAAENARVLLNIEPSVTERFSAVKDHPVTAWRIRHHGDYHLGQVLYTGQDFMIIDFEGEPARTLLERRAKALAMRDVAGMIRSFQYAAFSALLNQARILPSDSKTNHIAEGWAAAWNAVVSSTYLKAYFEQARDCSFVSQNWQERRVLLDAFLLQKALYEVAYELNNRPDWLPIPLRGILSLMGL